MEYRLLGGSGLKVSALSFGAGTFGGGHEFFDAWGATDDVAQARRLLDRASEQNLAYPYWHQRQFTERNPPPV